MDRRGVNSNTQTIRPLATERRDGGNMAKKGNGHIVARIRELRAAGLSKHDAGLQAHREAGHGKSKARGGGGRGLQGGRGVAFTGIV